MKTFNTKTQSKELMRYIDELGGLEYEVTIKKVTKTRTIPQNNSMWVWLTSMSKRFNDAGYDRIKTLKILRSRPEIEIPNDKDSFYQDVWMPAQRAIFPEKTGSSKLTTEEMQKVYETLNRYLGKTFGISEPWPDRFGR